MWFQSCTYDIGAMIVINVVVNPERKNVSRHAQQNNARDTHPTDHSPSLYLGCNPQRVTSTSKQLALEAYVQLIYAIHFGE